LFCLYLVDGFTAKRSQNHRRSKKRGAKNTKNFRTVHNITKLGFPFATFSGVAQCPPKDKRISGQLAEPNHLLSGAYPALGFVSGFVTPLRAASSGGSSWRPWSFVSSIHLSSAARKRFKVASFALEPARFFVSCGSICK